MDTIVRALQAGVSQRMAIRLAGISRSCFYEWQRRFPDFAEAVVRAEADVIAHLERVAFSLAIDSEDWRAISWLLERRFPEVYSLKRQPTDGDYEVELEVAPDDGGSSYTVQLASQPTNGTKP